MAEGITIVEHPAVAHRVGRLRDTQTDGDSFRQLVEEISGFLAYEALRDLRTRDSTVPTPIDPAAPCRVIDEQVLLVPIMRAGLGMIPGIQATIPGTHVAHLGMRRDEETFEVATYLDRLPGDLSGKRVVLCDPMLATGGSMIQACDLLAARGVVDPVVLCIVASRQGVSALADKYPQADAYCAALDPTLDDRCYIVPGLGDAGDRLFGPQPNPANPAGLRDSSRAKGFQPNPANPAGLRDSSRAKGFQPNPANPAEPGKSSRAEGFQPNPANPAEPGKSSRAEQSQPS